MPIGYQAEQKEVNQKRKEVNPIYPSPGNLDILANVGNRSRGRFPPSPSCIAELNAIAEIIRHESTSLSAAPPTPSS